MANKHFISKDIPDLTGQTRLAGLTIAIKGGGDLATGVALTLYRAGLRRIYIMETLAPTVIRREAALASAVFDTRIRVECVEGVLVETIEDIRAAWQQSALPVLADPQWQTLRICPPHVLIDATMAKKNLGTAMADAPLVIGMGPGFTAGKDVHVVIETLRGHDLGRIITRGSAAANTSRPEAVLGITHDRVIRAPGTGTFLAEVDIGALVAPGETLGRITVENRTLGVSSPISGVVRGLIRAGSPVQKGQKIGDVDPRGEIRYCRTCSDKARALGGAVLTAVLGACHG